MADFDFSKMKKHQAFLNKIHAYLSKTMSEEQIEEYRMTGFAPYIDIENNQTILNSVLEKNSYFVYLRTANENNIILEYRNGQFNRSNFKRVNDMYDDLKKHISVNMSKDSTYNPKEIAQYDAASSTKSMLYSFLKKDPLFVAKEKVRKVQEKVAQQLFGQWFEGANEIKFFELEHSVNSSEKTFIHLFEKEDNYKILQSTNSSSEQKNKELTLEDVSELLKLNVKKESLDNLQAVYILVSEQHLLEDKVKTFVADKIKAFRKPSGDDLNNPKKKY